MFKPVSPYYCWVKLPVRNLSGMASQRHCFSQNECQDSQSLVDAACIAEDDDGEGSRFHLIFMPRKTLCHDNEKPGTAQISVTLER